MIQPQKVFKNAIKKNITYWFSQFDTPFENQIELVDDHKNILNAVLEGIKYLDTQIQSIELALKVYSLVESWGFCSIWLPFYKHCASLNNIPVDIKVRVSFRLGRILYLNQSFQEAIKVHQMALKLSEGLDISFKNEALIYLCNDYIGARDYESAEKLGKEALDFYQSNPLYIEQQATLYNSLGIINIEKFKPEAAKFFLEKSVSLWERVDSQIQYARSLTNLGICYLSLKEWDNAELVYSKALQILDNFSNKGDWLYLVNSLGSLLYSQKKFNHAELYFRKGNAVGILVQGNYLIRASLAHNLGNCLLAQKQYLEAEHHLKRSLHLWMHLDEPIQLANSKITLAEVLIEKNDYSCAKIKLSEADALLNTKHQNLWAERLKQQVAEKYKIIKQVQSQKE